MRQTVLGTLGAAAGFGPAFFKQAHLPFGLLRLIPNSARSKPRSLRERVQLSQRVLRMFLPFRQQRKELMSMTRLRRLNAAIESGNGGPDLGGVGGMG